MLLTRILMWREVVAVLLISAGFNLTASAQPAKPNILILLPDDVGWENVSAYGLGVMGYRTPNIDRIAREGAMFTDHYAQQGNRISPREYSWSLMMRLAAASPALRRAT